MPLFRYSYDEQRRLLRRASSRTRLWLIDSHWKSLICSAPPPHLLLTVASHKLLAREIKFRAKKKKMRSGRRQWTRRVSGVLQAINSYNTSRRREFSSIVGARAVNSDGPVLDCNENLNDAFPISSVATPPKSCWMSGSRFSAPKVDCTDASAKICWLPRGPIVHSQSWQLFSAFILRVLFPFHSCWWIGEKVSACVTTVISGECWSI